MSTGASSHRTNDLYVTRDPVIGAVLQCSSSNGRAIWSTNITPELIDHGLRTKEGANLVDDDVVSQVGSATGPPGIGSNGMAGGAYSRAVLNGLALGNGSATATGPQAIVDASYPSEGGAIAIGCSGTGAGENGPIARGGGAVAIGSFLLSARYGALYLLGPIAEYGAVAMGPGTTSAEFSVAIGFRVRNIVARAVCFGYNSSNDGGVSIGSGVISGGLGNVVIGSSSSTTGTIGCTVVGSASLVTGSNTATFGTNITTNESGALCLFGGEASSAVTEFDNHAYIGALINEDYVVDIGDGGGVFCGYRNGDTPFAGAGIYNRQLPTQQVSTTTILPSMLRSGGIVYFNDSYTYTTGEAGYPVTMADAADVYVNGMKPGHTWTFSTVNLGTESVGFDPYSATTSAAGLVLGAGWTLSQSNTSLRLNPKCEDHWMVVVRQITPSVQFELTRLTPLTNTPTVWDGSGLQLTTEPEGTIVTVVGTPPVTTLATADSSKTITGFPSVQGILLNISAIGKAPNWELATITASEPLVMEIDTLGTTSFTLPLFNAFTYSIIDWGDASSDTVTVYNSPDLAHTYGAPGTYTVTIYGVNQVYFNNGGDRLKVSAITQWGSSARLGQSAYHGCTNLTLTATVGAPAQFSSNLSHAFNNCDAITTINDVSTWSPTAVTNMFSMFFSCANFDDDISAWDVSNVTNMFRMVQFCTSFNNGGQPLSWTTTNLQNINSMFSVAPFNQDISSWDVSNMTDVMFAFDGAAQFNNGFPAGVGSTSLDSWANQLGNLTSLNKMFGQNNAFNVNISSWDVSTITNFREMFVLSAVFNCGEAPGVSHTHMINWVGPSATDLFQMFAVATAFNGDISGWDVSNVTNMSEMFLNTTYAQDVSSWDVGSVTNFSNMFNGNNSATVACNWSTLNTSANVNMFQMFFNSQFNTPLDNWDVSRVTNFSSTFESCPFNQDVSSWTLHSTAAINMRAMFYANTAFNNAGVSSWDTQQVTNMEYMFGNATSFNQDISTWNTVNVTNMANMFEAATSFNNGGSGGIGTWNTQSVTTMSGMFRNATSFDQDLGTGGGAGTSWTLVSVTDITLMFNGATLSSANYNSLLIHWEAHVDTPNGLTFDGGNSVATGAGLTARTNLIGVKGWTITDAT